METQEDTLQDTTVVITGASSGIGLDTARMLGEEKANVVPAARRMDRIDGAAEQIRRVGGRALAVRADVTVLRTWRPWWRVPGRSSARSMH